MPEVNTSPLLTPNWDLEVDFETDKYYSAQIGEVARIVHFLKEHAVGRKIAKVEIKDDEIVYGKAQCTAPKFKKGVEHKEIVDVKQQGKYFWLVLDSLPHPLMHFGMSGWMKFSNDDTAYYKPLNEKGISGVEWPPKYWKFILTLEGEPECRIAFVDPRRLSRVRVVYVEADMMRDTAPLKQNGPDPVIDHEIITIDWLADKLRKKRVPVKALLLDQACISGIGNWVADEILYQARIHPEQYSNTFTDSQVKALHHSLVYVCAVAVETLADSSKFPDDWLMKYRWGKGKKGGDRLPSGEHIAHLKVGGRTSAIVPSVQIKNGPVAADVDDDTGEQKSALKTRGQRRPKAETTGNGANAEANNDAVNAESSKSGAMGQQEARDDSNAEIIEAGIQDQSRKQQQNAVFKLSPPPKKSTRSRNKDKKEDSKENKPAPIPPKPFTKAEAMKVTKQKAIRQKEEERLAKEQPTEAKAVKNTKRKAKRKGGEPVEKQPKQAKQAKRTREEDEDEDGNGNENENEDETPKAKRVKAN
ncbi:MAG: hypothetical protein M1822_007888 [Bathelium mastoideum]|nr:MAG: hypothetical protein M1822_007888 [Bathelium mastoideum]